MFFRFVSRVALLGSAGSALWFSSHIPEDIPNKEIFKKKDSKPLNTIGSLQDIKIFEKQRGCKIVFVKDFKKNENYNYEEWFKKQLNENPKHWENFFRSSLINAIIWNGANCKKGQVLTLEQKYRGNFKVKNNY